MDSLNNDNLDPINADSVTNRGANREGEALEGETRDREVRDRNVTDIPTSASAAAHPLGTGLGAAGGAAAGAAIGAVGGPVGAVVGGAIGAVVGGIAGKNTAEEINPAEEDAYWRDNYHTRPYATADRGYDYYQPAYRYGWESRSRYQGKQFDEVESDLQRDWNSQRPTKMEWNEARDPVRDAWQRSVGGLSSNLLSDAGL